MKRLLFLFTFIITTVANAQNYPITNVIITLPLNPPAKTADWATALPPVMITAKGALQNGQLNGMVQESKILVTIKKDGGKICGTYTPATAPNAGFSTLIKNWSGGAVLTFLGQDCTLQPGNYEFCVQFFTMNTPAKELSNEVCKAFTIKGKEDQQYSPPNNISPTDKKELTEREVQAPVAFRWTPLVPKPQQPVTYRLRVWQLMQGQSSAQAMRTNPPIVTKDVDNITQAMITGIYTGPCKPPYLCDFVWTVQAVDKQGTVLGTSEPTSFMVQNIDNQQFTPPTNVTPTDKKAFTEAEVKKAVSFRWTPLVPKPQQPVTYRLRVWQLMQGQSSSQAMRTNKPIITKDVADVTEASISGIYTGPCKPPYLCDYIWNVEAVSKEGTVLGSSEPSAFSVASADITITNFKVNCSTYGNYTYTITIENPGSNPFNLTSLVFNSMSGTISSVTSAPVVPTVLINPGTGNAVTITGTFAYSGTYSAAVVANASGNQVGNPLLTSQDTELDSLFACICKDCNEAQLTVNNPSVSVTNATTGLYTATGSLNISGLPNIYAIEMQVQSYSYTATPASCTNGVTSVETSGVFNLAGTTINGSPVSMINETVSGLPSTNNGVAKNIKLSSTTPLPANIPLNLIFGLPTPLAGLNNNCCQMSYTICLRIRVYYDKDKCNSCSFRYCFPVFTN
jgi:hypothetical protein